MAEESITIGIDVDGVVCDIIPQVCEHMNKKHGLSLVKSDINDWDFEITKESTLYNNIMECFEKPGFLLNAPPVEGAKQCIDYLKNIKHVKIKFITSRSKCWAPETKKWIDTNIGDYEVVHTVNGKKNGYDILIDDYHENLSSFLKEGGEFGVLMNQPWNQKVTEFMESNTKWKRANDWGDAVIAIEKWIGSTDVTNLPHYAAMKIQPIQYLKANLSHEEYIGYLKGNCLNYISVFDKRDGLTDLKKARTYLDWLIETVKSGKQ